MIAQRGEIDVEIVKMVEGEAEAELAQRLQAGELARAEIPHGSLAELEGQAVAKGAVLLQELDELREEIAVEQRLGGERAEHAFELGVRPQPPQ